MSTLAKPLLSPEEYLALERAAERKSEYYQGEMFAMSGASVLHNILVVALIETLAPLARAAGCLLLPSDMRVTVPGGTMYAYPDVSVVCGAMEVAEGDVLLNPTVLIEVLSPSTEAYDRGRKFQQYRRIPSLRDYILVSQDQIRVECYSRRDAGPWTLTEATSAEEELEIPSLGCRLKVSELYRNFSTVPDPLIRRMLP
jgi:Uma2 family endonuclease